MLKLKESCLSMACTSNRQIISSDIGLCSTVFFWPSNTSTPIHTGALWGVSQRWKVVCIHMLSCVWYVSKMKLFGGEKTNGNQSSEISQSAFWYCIWCFPQHACTSFPAFELYTPKSFMKKKNYTTSANPIEKVWKGLMGEQQVAKVCFQNKLKK